MMLLKRDRIIDIAKGIGMVMVVFGHTQSQFIQIVYQFHLPLFFFLSGVVFNENKVNDFPKFIFNKFRTLWVPFVKYEILFLFLHNLFSSIGLYTTISHYQQYYTFGEIVKRMGLILTMGYGEKLAGPLWFLISTLEIVLLFGCIVFILNKLKVQKKTRNLVIVVIALIGFAVGCQTHLPRMGSQSLIGLLFFATGFLFKDVKENVPYKWWLALMCAGVIFVCYKINYVDISRLDITYKSLLVVSGILGCYLTLFLSRCLPNIPAKMLEYCGKNTIPVLALHFISYKIVLLCEVLIYGLDWTYLGSFPTYDVNEVWSVLFTIVGVAMPLLMTWGIECIRMKFRAFHEKEIN